MARNFRRKQQPHPIAELNVTNLIDLGFMLLIIFMITAQMVKQEQTIPVRLPLESRSPQTKPEANVQFEAVSVDAAGRYYVGEDPTPIGIAALRERLRGFAARPKPPVIRSRGDGRVPYEDIIRLMDELKKANLTQVSFDTRTEP
ncbi:MAG: ExbD/TolR family protein [Opitutaceae bacterium]